VCDLTVSIYVLISVLSDMMKKATGKEAKAVTLVYWDIKDFPVPPGFDARRVRPCINQLLETHGYSGPLTIYAVGILTDVHVDILRALSSTGIILCYSPFGHTDIMSLMFRWMRNNSPPANLLGICDQNAFPPRESGFNLFSPFPYSSPEQEDSISWINLILTVSGTLQEDKCSETVESATWSCLACKSLHGEGFETFTGHLSSQEHKDMYREYLPVEDYLPLPRLRDEDENPPTIKATPEEAEAVTSVFWDINMFPVPPGFDARLVRPCIIRLLESHGYSAPPTIYAVGKLTDVHDDILQTLFSTGITLYYAPHGSAEMVLLMSQWISMNPPPANILGICDPRGFPLPLNGYNLFRPFSYSSPKQDSILWGNSLVTATPSQIQGLLKWILAVKRVDGIAYYAIMLVAEALKVSPSISLVEAIHMREILLRNGGREEEEKEYLAHGMVLFFYCW
ncbi:unnamed protein product, partial [Arabidopsis halleri]